MKVLNCNVSIDSHCFFCCLPANIFHGFSLLLLFVTSGVFLPFQVPSVCRKQQADPCAQAESRVKLRLRQAMETPGKHSQCISTWCHGFCSQQGSAVGCSDQACRGPPVRSCQRGAQQDKPMDRSRLRTGGTIIFFLRTFIEFSSCRNAIKFNSRSAGRMSRCNKSTRFPASVSTAQILHKSIYYHTFHREGTLPMGTELPVKSWTVALGPRRCRGCHCCCCFCPCCVLHQAMHSNFCCIVHICKAVSLDYTKFTLEGVFQIPASSQFC